MCFHDYEVVEEKNYIEIMIKVECDNLDQDYILENIVRTSGKKYRKKVCLKCGKIVDQITPVYNKIVKELQIKTERQEKARELIKKGEVRKTQAFMKKQRKGVIVSKFIVFTEGKTVYYGSISKKTTNSVFCQCESIFYIDIGLKGMKSYIKEEKNLDKLNYHRRISLTGKKYIKMFEKYTEMVKFLTIFNEICKKYECLRAPLEEKVYEFNHKMYEDMESIFTNKN